MTIAAVLKECVGGGLDYITETYKCINRKVDEKKNINQTWRVGCLEICELKKKIDLNKVANEDVILNTLDLILDKLEHVNKNVHYLKSCDREKLAEMLSEIQSYKATCGDNITTILLSDLKDMKFFDIALELTKGDC